VSSVELRPATRADVDALIAEPLPFRIKAWAAEHDGKLLGIGGLAFPPSGAVMAFVHVAPGAHRFKVAFHRAGLMAMAEAKRMGLRRVVATAESEHPRATAWLARLGFAPELVDGVTVWIWKGGA